MAECWSRGRSADRAEITAAAIMASTSMSRIPAARGLLNAAGDKYDAIVLDRMLPGDLDGSRRARDTGARSGSRRRS